MGTFLFLHNIMSNIHWYQTRDPVLKSKQTDCEDYQAGPRDCEDVGRVVEHGDLQQVGHHDVQHPDKAHYHRA